MIVRGRVCHVPFQSTNSRSRPSDNGRARALAQRSSSRIGEPSCNEIDQSLRNHDGLAWPATSQLLRHPRITKSRCYKIAIIQVCQHLHPRPDSAIDLDGNLNRFPHESLGITLRPRNVVERSGSDTTTPKFVRNMGNEWG